MPSANNTAARLARIIQFHRWAMPIVLSALGSGYTLWENILADGHALNSPEVLIGFALLGVIGPLVTFGTLTWAARAAAAWERAEQMRDRQQQQLLALNTIGEAVNQSLELDAVLDRTIDHMLDVLHLESGEVRLIQNDQLVLRSARGVSRAFLAAEQTIPLGQCLCGRSAQRGELIAVDDLGRVPQYASSACACERFSAVLCVPVQTADRVVGVVHVASKAPRVFNTADQALLTAIGYQVGAAIEKAQLHAQLKSLNQELEARVAERTRELVDAKEEVARHAEALQEVLAEERRVEEKTRTHIAHDLHDGVQQLIIGALFETQAARESLVQFPDAASSKIQAAQELLRRIESEMRHAIYSLRPVTLDVQGLVPALRECFADFERGAQIKCDLRIEGTPRRFDPEAEVAAFRIIQEALNNIEAHAQAKHAHIRIHFDSRNLDVQITDDGHGFAAAATNAARTQLGLIGMRERAERVGGALQVRSRIGEGTRVVLSVPIR